LLFQHLPPLWWACDQWHGITVALSIPRYRTAAATVAPGNDRLGQQVGGGISGTASQCVTQRTVRLDDGMAPDLQRLQTSE